LKGQTGNQGKGSNLKSHPTYGKIIGTTSKQLLPKRRKRGGPSWEKRVEDKRNIGYAIQRPRPNCSGVARHEIGGKKFLKVGIINDSGIAVL